MSLVQNHIVPSFPPQDCGVLKSEGVRSNANVEVKFIVPSSPKFLSTFGAAVVADDFEPGKKFLEFHLPVKDNTCRNDNQMWTPYPPIGGEVGQ